MLSKGNRKFAMHEHRKGFGVLMVGFSYTSRTIQDPHIIRNVSYYSHENFPVEIIQLATLVGANVSQDLV